MNRQDASEEAVKKPELLAPAGDERSLVAAVQSGADAVYLGLTDFSARRGARNFSLSELTAAVRYAHLRGCKTYLTLNVLILPQEMRRVLELAEGAREAGIDAFIVQDLGLARRLRSFFPDVALHGSTQLSTHTLDGVEALSAYGFDRVTLARELSVAQVKRLAEGPLPVEVFAHGALCYCYSGQCLLSSMVGGRSGNRGLCVQACRLSYELFASGKRVDVGGAHVLSTRDLSAIDIIPELVSAGVAAFKIEGRLKSHVYVATVVDVYRRAIDRYLADPDSYEVSAEDLEALQEAFSRGFTQGYLASIKDERMMGPARPSDRGVLVGRISSCDADRRTCMVKVSRELHAGDEIEVWVRRGGRVKSRVAGMKMDGHAVDTVKPGQEAALSLSGGAANDRVFRVENARLAERANEIIRPSGQVRFVSLTIHARVEPDRPLLISASTDDGVSVKVEGPVATSSPGRGVTREMVAERLRKVGGSAYRAGSIEVEVAEDASMPLSAVNSAKQLMLERLDEKRLSRWRRKKIAVAYEEPETRRRKPVHPALSVLTDDLALAGTLLDEGVDWLYHDASFERDRARLRRELRELAGAAKDSKTAFALLVPAVARESELRQFDVLVESARHGLDALVVSNIGQVRRYRDSAPALFADASMNVTNAETIAGLSTLGVGRFALSLELTGEQIAQLASEMSVPLEVLAFGSLQVMVGEHCLYSMPGSCSRCAGRQGFIRDEKGFEFRVRTDCACRTRVYNPFDLSLLRQSPELAAAGVNVLRLDLHGYSRERAVDVVRGWKNVLSLLPREPETALELAEELAGRLSARERFTTGHYFRPVV